MRDFGVARVLDGQLPVTDHRNIGRGAADVDGDDLVLMAGLAGPAPADHPAGRPRQQKSHGRFTGLFHGRHAAVRLHHPHERRHARRLQSFLQVIQVMGSARADIGVHRGGREALVLSHRVHHFA